MVTSPNFTLQASNVLPDPTMLTNPNLLFSKAEWCRHRIHLRCTHLGTDGHIS